MFKVDRWVTTRLVIFYFFGVGMYVASSTQIAMFFSLAEWTDAGGEKTFVHTIPQFFQGFWCWNIISRKLFRQ